VCCTANGQPIRIVDVDHPAAAGPLIPECRTPSASKCAIHASAAFYLGLALLAPTLWGLVLFPAAVLLVVWGAIRPEERFLHERFGAVYDDYTRRVRRWL
jgi:hypothetical protein